MELFPFLFVPAVITAVLVLMSMKQHAIATQHVATGALRSLTEKIADATAAYAEQQFLRVMVVALVIFVGLAVLLPLAGWYLALGFLVGVVLSVTAGYIGLHAAHSGVPRVIHAATRADRLSLFRMSLGSGLVVALTTAALSLLGVAGLFWGLQNLAGLDVLRASETVIGFAFGAAATAVLLRMSGGIFAKSCDLAEDRLVRTVDGFDAHDPKNPVTIADNVGDHAGDNIGAGAGMFATQTIAVIAAMLIAGGQMVGVALFSPMHLFLPLVLAATGMLAVLLGSTLVRGGHTHAALLHGCVAVGVFLIAGFFGINIFLTGDLSFVAAVACGVVASVAGLFVTEYFTASDREPTRLLARALGEGAGVGIVSGLGVGLRATLALVVLLIAAFLSSFYFASYYGVALAAVAASSVMTYVYATGVAAVIADNAAGIGAMLRVPRAAQGALDHLDELGNTVAASAKAMGLFTIGMVASAFFFVVRDSFFSYGARADMLTLDFASPSVVVGVAIGVMVPFFFAGMLLMAVVRATRHVVYAATQRSDVLTIALRHSWRLLQRPFLLVLVLPFFVAYVFGVATLLGMLVAFAMTGIVLALAFAVAGSALDNAKHRILTEKNTAATRDAAQIGDTVGDPLKDTVAPALGVLVEMMILLSLIVATVGATWIGLV